MKKIKSIKAVGYQVLVEMLTQQEASGSALTLPTADSTQAYVRMIGPLVDEKAGLKKGDRVVLQGNYVPVPTPDGSNRKWGVVEMHNVKAVLEEG